MPIKEKRVGTEGGKKSKSAYQRKKVGTHRDNKGKSACHKERNKYAIHKPANKKSRLN